MSGEATEHFRAGDGDEGGRLDVFLAHHAGLSRSRIQSLIREGAVTIAGAAVKASHTLRAGDEIAVEMREPVEAKTLPEAIALAVLYEDSSLIVVNKPRGMVVHPGCGVESGTLVNALLAHCVDLSGIGGEKRPGIVHRLDRYTSGVMMAAKSDSAHEALTAQFAARTVKKEYLAIVYGAPKDERGSIDAPVGRHPVDRKRMAVVESGRAAVTGYRVEERFDGYSLVRLFPLTGRTHQLRVHLTAMGHPIVGDEVYGKRAHGFPIKGQALHAASLSFAHPQTGREMRFTAPLPEDMEAILAALRGR